MWGRRWIIGIGFSCCCLAYGYAGRLFAGLSLPGQINGDTLHHHGDTLNRRISRQDLDYSILFSNFLFLDWSHEKNANQAGFLQNLRYQVTIGKFPVCRFSGTLTHNLGIQSFFDSITKVQTDNNNLAVNADLFLKTKIHFVVGIVVETQLLNGYSYSTISGSLDKTRISAFLTPMICTVSLGPGVNWNNFGSLNLGVSGFKLTWLRDRRIAERYAESMYDISQGKNHKSEYGLTLHFMADREIVHGVRWNCDLLFFKNYKKPIDMTLRNLFGIRINKFLKTSVQTRILYEKKIIDHLQVENMISVGFYFHR